MIVETSEIECKTVLIHSKAFQIPPLEKVVFSSITIATHISKLDPNITQPPVVPILNLILDGLSKA